MPLLRPAVPYNRFEHSTLDSKKTLTQLSNIIKFAESNTPEAIERRGEERRMRVRLNTLKRENRAAAKIGSKNRTERMDLVRSLVDITYPAVFSEYSLETSCEYKPGLVKRNPEQFIKRAATMARLKAARLEARKVYEKEFNITKPARKPAIDVEALRKTAQRENSVAFQQSQERLKKWRLGV